MVVVDNIVHNEGEDGLDGLYVRKSNGENNDIIEDGNDEDNDVIEDGDDKDNEKKRRQQEIISRMLRTGLCRELALLDVQVDVPEVGVSDVEVGVEEVEKVWGFDPEHI